MKLNMFYLIVFLSISGCEKPYLPDEQNENIGHKSHENIKQNLIAPPTTDPVLIKIPYCTGGRCGVYDLSQGKFSTEPVWESLFGWTTSINYAVKKDNKWGFLSKDGALIVPPIYDDTFGFYSKGYAIVKLKNKFGVINSQGEHIIPVEYDSIGTSDSGVFSVTKGKYEGYLNFDGSKKTEIIYESLGGFYDGRAFTQIKGKFGFIDENGEMVIPAIYQDRTVYGFRNGLAGVKINGKWGYINTAGEMVIPAVYDDVRDFEKNGITAVEKDGLWGYIDTKGNTVIDFKFEWAVEFENNFARVKKNGKYGFINELGEIVISAQYDDIYDFKEDGTAPVKLNGKWGRINSAGKLFIPAIYDYPGSDAVDGFRVYELNGKYGVIDSQNKIHIPFEYERISIDGDNNLFDLEKDGKKSISNYQGDLLVSIDFICDTEVVRNSQSKIVWPKKDATEICAEAQYAKLKSESERVRLIQEQKDYANKSCAHVYVGKEFESRGGVFGLTQYYIVVGFSVDSQKVTIRGKNSDYRQEVSCWDIPQ